MKKNIPVKYIYAAIWVALVGLLFSMFGFSHLHSRSANMILTLTFAVAQMLLTMLFFMRLRHSPRLLWIFAGAGFFWLLIMFTLMASDYFTRAWH